MEEPTKSLRFACVTFTMRGARLAKRLKAAFEHQPFSWLTRPLSTLQRHQFPRSRVDIFTKDRHAIQFAAIFQNYDGIIFFCATGQAVRLSAPFLQDVMCEPAIVVVDDCGRYAISLTAGRLGEAHSLTEMVADILGCQPIITTASDGCGIEAIDLFAKRHEFLIENLRHATHITTLMVEGVPIQLISEVPVTINYHHLVEAHPHACIYVTSQEQIDCSLPYCILRPRNLNIGINCRGKSKDAILEALIQVFQVHNLSMNSIRTLASVESARNEAGLRDAQNVLHCELAFFDRHAIKRLQSRFSPQQFGQSNIGGVPSICEPCACLVGGKIIVGKTVIDGIIVAVAR